VKEVQFGSHTGLPTSDAEHMRDAQELRTYPTPAEFLVQVGRVVAVCLGLALLAQAVVAMVGT
jgi:hypothetical protein